MQAWADYLDGLRAGKRETTPTPIHSPQPTAPPRGQTNHQNISRKDGEMQDGTVPQMELFS